MGETTETSWAAGLCLLVCVVAFLLAGIKWGGGVQTPQVHNLICQSYGDKFECRERP